MLNDQTSPSQVQHPLEVLAEIEWAGTVNQEVAPLSEPESSWSGMAAFGLDEGHAGGCG
ncbi:DUF6269 family protein [Streptomyces syringium]|uniref:DUF6269 family protein n=1 Tax=Streptomyces syringium TaxID=76729 RepID=UPI00343324A6